MINQEHFNTVAVVNNDKSRIILTHATGEDIIISGISAGSMTIG